MMEERRKIFILDDEDLVVWCLQKAFEKEGFSVSSASTVADALEMVRKESFDFYLIDVYLPDGSGLDVIDAVRDNDPNARIFIITAYHSSGAVRRKMLAGTVRGLIKKPFKVKEVIRIIEEAV